MYVCMYVYAFPLSVRIRTHAVAVLYGIDCMLVK